MDILGGKWRSLIFWHLGEKKHRFGELQRIVPGISKKVLTEHLKNLERGGFIKREVFPEVPPRVEYSITSKGEELLEVLSVMEKWGRNFLEAEGEKL
jgi:DNA-binding HxlR family transcriptional regulator